MTTSISEEALIYKGVFTTLDSKSKAKVTIEDIATSKKGNSFVATFNFNNKKKQIIINRIKDKSIEGLYHFKKQGLQFSFDILNQNNPIFEMVSLNGNEASIVGLNVTNTKNSNAIVGTYKCVVCGTHSGLNGDSDKTFNAVIANNVNNQTVIITQIVYNNNVYEETGIVTSCNDTQNESTCTMEGIVTLNATNIINWDGTYTHKIINNSVSSLEDFSGKWVWHSSNFGTLQGTFIGK